MNQFTWLVGHSVRYLTRREFDWLLEFDKSAYLVIGCLWRLVEAGRIRVTSQDEGQQFGLPAPVDTAAEVNRRIAAALVEAVSLREGTLDLELRFKSGHILQIIPNSSGYEAWTLSNGSGQLIAVGGGELVSSSGNHAGR